METINERIQLIIIQYYDGNVSKYCRDVNVKQTTMNEIIGKSQMKPSAATLAKLLTGRLVKVNIEWILSGQGDPVKKEHVIHQAGVMTLENDLSEAIRDERIKNAIYLEQLAEARRVISDLTELNAILKFKQQQKNDEEATLA